MNKPHSNALSTLAMDMIKRDVGWLMNEGEMIGYREGQGSFGK